VPPLLLVGIDEEAAKELACRLEERGSGYGGMKLSRRQARRRFCSRNMTVDLCTGIEPLRPACMRVHLGTPKILC